jgi:hypothetical protein
LLHSLFHQTINPSPSSTNNNNKTMDSSNDDLTSPLLSNAPSSAIEQNPITAEQVRDEARRVLNAANTAHEDTCKILGSPWKQHNNKQKESVGSLSVDERRSANDVSSNWNVKRAAVSAVRKAWALYYGIKRRFASAPPAAAAAAEEDGSYEDVVNRNQVSFLLLYLFISYNQHNISSAFPCNNNT